MHDSMRRLHEISGKHKKRDIAKDLKVSPSTVTNWAARGVSKEGALEAADFYKSNANYILNGINYSDDDSNDATSQSHRQPADNEMPVFKSVSIDSYSKRHDNANIVDYIAKPSHLTSECFALIVAGRSMMPEFKAGDYVYIDTDVNVRNLEDGDFVIVQHRDSDYAVIKQVIIGADVNQIYLTQLNKDMPDSDVASINDYEFFGVVDSKLTKYR